MGQAHVRWLCAATANHFIITPDGKEVVLALSGWLDDIID